MDSAVLYTPPSYLPRLPIPISRVLQNPQVLHNMSQSEFIPRHDWAVRALNSTERESIAFDLLSDNLGLSLGPYMLASVTVTYGCPV